MSLLGSRPRTLITRLVVAWPPLTTLNFRSDEDVDVTLNVGFETVSFCGSDQLICCTPDGRLKSMPRTRYHQVPGASGSTSDVDHVRKPLPFVRGSISGRNG